MATRPLPLGAFVAALTFAAPASAWVERTVRSDAVVVDVGEDGMAVVSHEILLAVRGGPLADISVEPVDADAELLPEATVTLAASGQSAGLPIPLVPTKEGARLSLHVERDRGLRTGVYQVRFGYRTNLAAAHRLEPTNTGTLVSWAGPAFMDGLDSARVVFRLPRRETPPRLRTSGSEREGSGIADDRSGVFLSTFRRTEGKDELEIVRPHVSRGEIVAWSVLVDPSAFDRPAAPGEAKVGSDVAAPAPAPVLPRAHEAAPRPPAWLVGLLISSIAGLYGLLVASKARWVKEACEGSRATPKTLLPVSTRTRVIAATLAVSAFAATALLEQPWLSVTSLMVAFAAAVHLTPSVSQPLRGPGKWSKLEPEALLGDPERHPRAMGRLFDAGTLLGFVLFCSLLAAFAAAALVVARHSPFHGVAVGLAASLLFPVFCTGREAELHDPARVLSALDWMHGALRREPHLDVGVIGRVPQGRESADELRILVLPRRPLPGVLAIEVGFDAHAGPLGIENLPFVILRVTEGSAAEDAMPRGFLWTRGRSADERVLVLRPKLPARRIACDLARDLARRLTAPDARQPRSAARSSGKDASASKGATSASPAHAT